MTKSQQEYNFQRRIESIRLRINSLDSLRKMVALQPAYDITDRQWTALSSQLSTLKTRLMLELKRGSRKYLPQIHDPRVAITLNAFLGEIEMEMAKAFVFFDTYMDVLTQRHSPELGPVLAGCDVLARCVIHRDNPTLSIVEPPVVYCNRGFGAATLREGIFLGRIPNPLPLIQIPYSRLKEKHNLTSIFHEAGHEAMVRLGMTRTIPHVLNSTLNRAGAPDPIAKLLAFWASEIDPDFWTFCASGIAQPATIREILALPQDRVFRVSGTDPHPPPYLRVLLSFEWCRQVWGKGIWDKWEGEWLKLYPLEEASTKEEKILSEAREWLPLTSRVLLNTKFRVLNTGTIPDLFNLSELAPSKLQKIARTADSGFLDLKGLSPAAQLTVFRLIRENGKFSEGTLDIKMTEWLSKLGEKRKHFD